MEVHEWDSVGDCIGLHSSYTYGVSLNSSGGG